MQRGEERPIPVLGPGACCWAAGVHWVEALASGLPAGWMLLMSGLQVISQPRTPPGGFSGENVLFHGKGTRIKGTGCRAIIGVSRSSQRQFGGSTKGAHPTVHILTNVHSKTAMK